MKKTFTIEVADNWIEDGFDLTPERIHRGVMSELPYAYDYEVKIEEVKEKE